MAGLSLRGGASARAGTGPSGVSGNISSSAFNPGATTPMSSASNDMSNLSPTGPTGQGLFVSIAALAVLVFIRHSLPR